VEPGNHHRGPPAPVAATLYQEVQDDRRRGGKEIPEHMQLAPWGGYRKLTTGHDAEAES